eukprot:TRINITY_DN2546_c0_g1_i4.p1 TRINITY_DN2546_c0_g1~~TRINITY_DN2546_c0_g1_i4.p1  ORF type:complete len:228 (+),score=11.20 TRINITY_DN2546_c0_g1_i4:75-758(+)
MIWLILVIFASCFFPAASEMPFLDMPFNTNQEIKIECRDWVTGDWSDVKCVGDNQPLTLTFGTDQFLQCGIHISSQEHYQALSKFLLLQESWQCRIPISFERSVFMPFTIPLWGIVEPTHMHVNVHSNFVVHVQSGHILGAGAYPMRDRLQVIGVGSVMYFHGPVRWFHAGSYHASDHHDLIDLQTGITSIVIYWCMLVFFVTVFLMMMLYFLVVRPRLTRKLIKQD